MSTILYILKKKRYIYTSIGQKIVQISSPLLEKTKINKDKCNSLTQDSNSKVLSKKYCFPYWNKENI